VVEIELLGKPNHWSYKQGHIRIGRDSICEVSLPANEYPMVSREHVVLEVGEDTVRMSDARSANGTFLNGTRTSAAIVRSGDVIRLGPDGPELRIRVVHVNAQPPGETPHVSEAATRIAGSAPIPAAPVATVVRGGSDAAPAATVVRAGSDAAPAATVMRAGSDPAPAATVMRSQHEPAETVLRAPEDSAAHASAVHVGLGAAPPPQTTSRVMPSETPRAATHVSLGDEQMIERKLDSIRNLLGANLAVMLVLLFGLLYENQQISRNRDTLLEMRKQAQTAVGQFTPALDARLGAFESRLGAFEKRADGLDGKMKEAEDHFIGRVDKEMPVVLDKYVNRKMEEMKRQAPALPPQ